MIAEAVSKLETEQPVVSQRQLAEESGIPRSTLQHWLERRDTLEADPAVVAFFESPAGVAFLHRLVIAAHVVMTLVGLRRELSRAAVWHSSGVSVSGTDGVARLCRGVLRPAAQGLGRPRKGGGGVRASRATALGAGDDAQADHGVSGRDLSSRDVPGRHRAGLQLHPVGKVCGEPEGRDLDAVDGRGFGEGFGRASAEPLSRAATQGLPVELVQSTSDEGRGTLCGHHVEVDLGLHHSPDVFHLQQDLVQGSRVVLANRKRQAEQAAAEAAQQVSRLKEAPSTNVKPDGPSDGDAALVQPWVTAQAQEQKAREAVETITGQQQRVQEAVAGISTAYHPYDLETGAARSAEQLADALAQHWSEIETVAAEVNLPERCVKKIQKAKRVVVEMVATLAFFWLTVRAKVEALSLAPAVEQALYHHLIPAIYLHLVSEKTSDPQQRQTLQTKSDELLAPLVRPDGPWAGLEQAEMQVMEAVALRKVCAQVFQRSSSCVRVRGAQWTIGAPAP